MTVLLCTLLVLAFLTWLVPLTRDPGRVGLYLLALGTIAQTVALALSAKTLGPLLQFAPAWKEFLIALIVLVLLARGTATGGLLPRSIALALSLYGAHVLALLAFPDLLTPTTADDGLIVARLAGARQWLVPAYLIIFGALLSRRALARDAFSWFVTAYGTCISIVAVLDWLFVPVSHWAAATVVTGGLESIASESEQYDGFHSHFFGVAVPRALAPFGSPLALAFSLTLPLIIAFLRPSSGSRNFQLLLMTAALALTQTRSIILALLIVWLLTTVRRKRVDGLVITVAMATMLLGVDVLRRAIRSTATLEDPSARVHFEQVIAGWRHLVDNPWGYGLGQGGRHGRVLGEALAGGENLYLVAGNERGWLGLALLVAAGMLIYLQVGNRAARAVHPLHRACHLTLLVFAIASLTTEHAIAFNSTWTFWIAIGYCLSPEPPLPSDKTASGAAPSESRPTMIGAQ